MHRKNRYALILLDLRMPDMDGFQVMESLKAIETEGYLSVLVFTAHPAHKLRALQAGAKDFVPKPLFLQEVLLRVHNLLEVRLLHRVRPADPRNWRPPTMNWRPFPIPFLMICAHHSATSPVFPGSS